MNQVDVENFYRLLIIIICFISCLSLICCLLVIFMFILKRNLRTFVCELLFYMAISELLNSIRKLISLYKLNYHGSLHDGLRDQTSIYCHIQRFLGNYSDFCTFIIIVMISYSLNNIMIKMNKNVVNKIKYFRLIIFIVPLIITSS
jgi:hypothetical protein